jgi:lysophospholipase L1-like esterase
MPVRQKSIAKINCNPTSWALFSAVGDSIVLGAGPVPDIGGFRAPLFAQNPGCIFIGTLFTVGYHCGYDGATIATISSNVLPYLAVIAPPPKYILLMAGLNDLAAGTTPSATLALLQTFITNMFAAQAGIAKIIVSTVPHNGDAIGQVEYNNLILGMSMTNVIVVDGCGTLIPVTDYSTGDHPNNGGYAKIAAQISPTIAGLL